MESPHSLRDDFSYPRYLTRQIFAWGSFGGLWRLLLPEDQYAYGGFEFRNELRVSERLDDLALTFRLQPTEAAPYLRVALAGRDAHDQPLFTDVQLTDLFLNPFRNGCLVSIRLNEFPEQAQILEGGDETMRKMDWNRLYQMRIISTLPEHPALAISITHLQIGPVPAFRK